MDMQLGRTIMHCHAVCHFSHLWARPPSGHGTHRELCQARPRCGHVLVLFFLLLLFFLFLLLPRSSRCTLPCLFFCKYNNCIAQSLQIVTIKAKNRHAVQLQVQIIATMGSTLLAVPRWWHASCARSLSLLQTMTCWNEHQKSELAVPCLWSLDAGSHHKCRLAAHPILGTRLLLSLFPTHPLPHQRLLTPPLQSIHPQSPAASLSARDGSAIHHSNTTEVNSLLNFNTA